jgi:hypothetical protein
VQCATRNLPTVPVQRLLLLKARTQLIAEVCCEVLLVQQLRLSRADVVRHILHQEALEGAGLVAAASTTLVSTPAGEHTRHNTSWDCCNCYKQHAFT